MKQVCVLVILSVIVLLPGTLANEVLPAVVTHTAKIQPKVLKEKLVFPLPLVSVESEVNVPMAPGEVEDSVELPIYASSSEISIDGTEEATIKETGIHVAFPVSDSLDVSVGAFLARVDMGSVTKEERVAIFRIGIQF